MYELTKYGKYLLKMIPEDQPVTLIFKKESVNLRTLDPQHYEKLYYKGSAIFQPKTAPKLPKKSKVEKTATK